MSKMNQEVKAKWVAALRSGEYQQGRRTLLNEGDGNWCCLGVLCDIYAKEEGIDWRWARGEGMSLSGIGGVYYPADVVREWASFNEDEQPVQIGENTCSVAVHNDGHTVKRCTFSEIADAIEAQL